MSKRVVAGMATMPTRAHSLPAAIASVIDQVDRLYLYLDGFSAAPDIVGSSDKIVPILSDKFPGLHADGRYVGLLLEERSCYYLGPDDDIIYPPTYVSDLIEVVDRHDGRVIAGVHGVILVPPLFSYIRNRTVYNFATSLDTETRVDVLGSGTTLFDTECFHFDVRQWLHNNVTDLSLAIEAERQGVRRIAIKRRETYLRSIEAGQADSLWARAVEDDSVQTKLANELLRVTKAANARAYGLPQ